jgi:Uma2 family endonuclease
MTQLFTPKPAMPSLIPPFPDESLYETVNGQRVELPFMGAFESFIANSLMAFLAPFASAKKLGRVYVEMLFRLVAANNQERRPDVAFVSFSRWPLTRSIPHTSAWEVAPDLAVEVISPSNQATEVVTKIGDYFLAGVRLVWVIYPVQEMVYVYKSPTNIRAFSRQDALEGDEVLPGFLLPLSELFIEPIE